MSESVPPLEDLIRIAVVAKRLDVRIETVLRWRSTGRLKCWRVGHAWYTTADEVRRFIAAGTDPAPRVVDPAAPAVPVAGVYSARRRKQIDKAKSYFGLN